MKGISHLLPKLSVWRKEKVGGSANINKMTKPYVDNC